MANVTNINANEQNTTGKTIVSTRTDFDVDVVAIKKKKTKTLNFISIY